MGWVARNLFPLQAEEDTQIAQSTSVLNAAQAEVLMGG
jgi:hypothetical protein